MNDWRRIFTLPAYTSNFEPPTDEIVLKTLTGTRESVTAYFLSASGIAMQPQEEKAKITAQIAAVLEKGEGLVWLDKEKGQFEYPFATNVVVMKRKHV